MNYIVYKTTNLLNGRFYVGVHGTKDSNEFDGYFGTGKLIKAAIEKYGKENFVREILIDCFEDEQEAYSIEKILVKTNKEDLRSYNLVEGGCGGSVVGILGALAVLKLGKNWFQNCTKEDLLKYSKKSNETKRLRNSRCDFKNIEWQRENSRNNDHSGARGILTFNNGSSEFKFKPSNRNDKISYKKELEIFLEKNPSFKRGRLNKTIGRPKRYSYTDEERNYYFSASSIETSEQDASKQFHKFLINNTKFIAGRFKTAITKGVN